MIKIYKIYKKYFKMMIIKIIIAIVLGESLHVMSCVTTSDLRSLVLLCGSFVSTGNVLKEKTEETRP